MYAEMACIAVQAMYEQSKQKSSLKFIKETQKHTGSRIHRKTQPHNEFLEIPNKIIPLYHNNTSVRSRSIKYTNSTQSQTKSRFYY